MRNPWIDLPETAPYVLVCDKLGILGFNNQAKPEHTIRLELLPEPNTGNPEAKILLLNLNPGFYARIEKFLRGDEHFFKASRANLTHTQQEFPFYLLGPRNAASPGYYWWSRKLKPLVDLYGLKRNALIIQMRSRRVWQSAILGLGSYLNYYELKNPQNPTISENNCPSGFPEILKVLG